MRYRPHLDGLRAVAVVLVIAFHAGLGAFSGGFIGVDVFFVLSGFLVTQILLRDLSSTGHVRYREFYARRVRRILPAAAVMLIVTAVVYSIVASPPEMLDAMGGFRAAFLYVANWYFIHQSTDYFAANVNSNPVMHFWSLAVEEQFYLVWPLLMGGLFLLTARLRSGRWWVLRITVIAAGVASAVGALYLGGTNVSRAYYGTDTRAYQLLAGAALALTPQLLRLGSRTWRYASWCATAAVAGLFLLATSVFHWSPITRGILVAALVVVLLVALENARGGAAKSTLAWGPLTYLGRISYGIYLWHWPVIVIASHGRDLSPTTLFVLSCGIATALAAVSFHVMEHPIRAGRVLDRYKTPVVAVGLATSVLCGVLVIPAILDTGNGSISAQPGSTGPSGLRLLDWRKAQKDIPTVPDCVGKPVAQCTVVAGKGMRVVLMGDSYAQMWTPTFAEIAKQRSWHLSLAAYPTCPWQAGLLAVYTDKAMDDCATHQRDWYGRIIPELDPDMIIVSNQAFDDPGRPLFFKGPRGGLGFGAPGFERGITEVSSAALRKLERPNRKVVILEPIPVVPVDADPLSCLSLGRAPSRCVYTANRKTTPLEQFYRSVNRPPSVTTLDLDRLACPRLPACDPIVDNIIVKRDRTHLTETFARALGPKVDALIPR